jgi:hypothetical protein
MNIVARMIGRRVAFYQGRKFLCYQTPGVTLHEMYRRIYAAYGETIA